MSAAAEKEELKKQARAALEVAAALAEALRALGSVPSGHLYAHVMGTLSLADYERVIGILKGAGLVKEEGHVLTWIGPKL